MSIYFKSWPLMSPNENKVLATLVNAADHIGNGRNRLSLDMSQPSGSNATNRPYIGVYHARDNDHATHHYNLIIYRYDIKSPWGIDFQEGPETQGSGRIRELESVLGGGITSELKFLAGDVVGTGKPSRANLGDNPIESLEIDLLKRIARYVKDQRGIRKVAVGTRDNIIKIE